MTSLVVPPPSTSLAAAEIAARSRISLPVLVTRKLAGTLFIVGILAVVSWLLYALAATLGNTTFWGLLEEPWGETGESIGNVIGLMLVSVMVLATLLTMADRKWSALMQDRVGPNRARLPIPGLKQFPLWGIPHIAADVLKMLLKEDFAPDWGNKVLHQIAPLLAFGVPFCLFAVVPAGPQVVFFGREVALWAAPGLDIGLLYLFAMASLAVFGTSLAGWASNNKLALLGGLRASAQLVSYEVTLGLTLVGSMLAYQTLQLDDMAMRQGAHLWGWLPAWGVFLQPVGLLAYFAAASAEVKRPPFDMPEGESEIIGYFIEYSGLKFGLFLIAEYIEVVVFAGVLVAVFFGSYRFPFGESWLLAHLGSALFGVASAAWFWLKVLFFCWLSIAVRFTFPRFRYDQVMHLGWKILLPVSIANVLVTAVAVLVDPSLELLAVIGLCEIALAAIVVGVSVSKPAQQTQPAGGH